MTGLPSLLFNRRMLVCVLTGFSSGLPLYLGTALIQAWLHGGGVSLHTIGLFNLTGLPYVFKFAWAPLLDRFGLGPLGRRRSWALAMQVALLFSVAGFGWLDPAHSLQSIAWLALAVAVFSATQDVALDAYRRELLAEHEFGLGTAVYVNAYRVAQLVPALALMLADQMPWRHVFMIVSAFMLVGILTSIFGPSPTGDVSAPRTLFEAVTGPFIEFFTRAGRSTALLMLAFMLLYKFGDTLAAALLTPFYLEIGFSKTEVGSIAKMVVIPSSAVGLLVGGVTIAKIGINRALWIFGLGQMISTLGFSLLARLGPEPLALATVVSVENLAGGLGTAAFIAFLSRATDRRFTATQYALFSALVALPRTAATATTGYVVEWIGFESFFMLCTALALPGMLLLFKVARWGAPARVATEVTAAE
jgi:MFS transporter, PAT family, beta-lactamase induction signal transducer AmpG